MSELQGKVALITGAGRGIGRVVALTLAEQGMKIGVNDLDPTTAQKVADEICAKGGTALAVPANVALGSEVVAMVNLVEAELGSLWLLVNNAGIFNAAPTAEMSEEAWDKVFDVDAKGVFLCSQAAIRKMIPRKGGRIVNFASIAGMIVRTAQISYCSAKAAVIHFSRRLAVEMAPHGITVNCLCPGMTWTDMLAVSAKERGLRFRCNGRVNPAGCMAKEEDHAHLIVFFASPEAGHITGQVVAVDGGQSLYHPLQMKH